MDRAGLLGVSRTRRLSPYVPTLEKKPFWDGGDRSRAELDLV